MIPIYIGSHEKFACAEGAIVNSIKANTSSETDIKIIRPDYIGMGPTGCTGFTNVRFVIPELLRNDGYEFGIYLDVDMILLSDIKELYDYRKKGKYVCMQDGSTEVAVISSDVDMPTKNECFYANKTKLMAMLPKACDIPTCWNVEDRICDDAKLIHFTDLKRQPWFYDGHPCPEAVNLWESYANNP